MIVSDSWIMMIYFQAIIKTIYDINFVVCKQKNCNWIESHMIVHTDVNKLLSYISTHYAVEKLKTGKKNTKKMLTRIQQFLEQEKKIYCLKAHCNAIVINDQKTFEWCNLNAQFYPFHCFLVHAYHLSLRILYAEEVYNAVIPPFYCTKSWRRKRKMILQLIVVNLFTSFINVGHKNDEIEWFIC